MAAIRTSLSIPTQPWEAAKRRFCASLSAQEAQSYETATPENLFYDASCAKKQHTESSRIWRLQQRLSPLVDSIEEYGKAMDVFVNTCPLILSPLWGSIRVVLLIAAEAAAFQEKLVDCLAQIGDVLPRFRVYEVLFKNHERLLVAMSSAYLDVLQFCDATREFFSRSKRSFIPLSIALRGLWASHLRTFDGYMGSLRTHSKRVTKEAGLAHMIESARNRELQLRSQALQIRNAKLETRNQALVCLPAVDYSSKQSRLYSLRHPGTCVWLQNTPEFASWIASLKSACLCCYGIPGSGKSVLAASLTTVLQGRRVAANNDLVCYYYFDYADHGSLDSPRAVASLVKQALENLPLDHFDENFSCPYRHGQQLPAMSDSIQYLAGILKHFGTVHFILDGIDELSVRDQAHAVSLIDSLLQHPDLLVKIFVTSRTEEFRGKQALHNHETLYMSQKEVDADIAKFIEQEVDSIEAPHPLTVDPILRTQVVQALVQGAKGMFLWANFQLIDVKEALTEEAVRDTLAHLPTTLAETYLRIVRKIHNSPGGAAKFDLMRKAFQWIAVSRRPLRLEELEEAVALEASDTYLHTDRIPRHMGGRLLCACGSLAVLNEEANTVSFAHYTVKQFFFSLHEDPLLSVMSLKSSEMDVGGLCLAYLSFSDFETQIAHVPSQVQIGPALAEGVLWANIPFAKSLRRAVNLIQPLRSDVKNDIGRTLKFAVPVPSGPGGLLMRQYFLLEYIIEYWVHHTSGLRRQTSSPSWSRFEHVALHRQLPFEFRPWNDHNHRILTRKGLQMLEHTYEKRNSRIARSHSSTLLDSPEAMMHITIYVWALRHAVGSLFGLLGRPAMESYLDLVRSKTILMGMQSGLVNSEHLFSVFDRFPLERIERDATNISLAHDRSEWTGDLVVRLLDLSTQISSMLEATPTLLYLFLGHQLCYWVDQQLWHDLEVSTAIYALRVGNHAAFRCVYQECVGDNYQFATRTSAYWQKDASSKIVKGCLTRPARGAAYTSSIQWDTVFMLERYYSTGNLLLWISELLPASGVDLCIGQALVVVSLAHRQSLSYVTAILKNIGINGTMDCKFRPLGNWDSSTFGSPDAHHRLAPFLHVDVFDLIQQLNVLGPRCFQAGSSRQHVNENQLEWIASINQVVQVWQLNRQCFSVESLERNGVHLLSWAVHWAAHDGDPITVYALLPLYKEYAKTSQGATAVLRIVKDYGDDAPRVTIQRMRISLGCT